MKIAIIGSGSGAGVRLALKMALESGGAGAVVDMGLIQESEPYTIDIDSFADYPPAMEAEKDNRPGYRKLETGRKRWRR